MLKELKGLKGACSFNHKQYKINFNHKKYDVCFQLQHINRFQLQANIPFFLGLKLMKRYIHFRMNFYCIFFIYKNASTPIYKCKKHRWCATYKKKDRRCNWKQSKMLWALITASGESSKLGA
jgi:hypothetical protein